MAIDGFLPEYTSHPSQEDQDRRKHLFTIASYFKRYFKYEVVGLEHIPKEGRAIILPFHGLLPVDMWLLMNEVYTNYGRLVWGLTDHRIFAIPFLRRLFVIGGALDGTHENGKKILQEENGLLIISPGGAREGWRSSMSKYQLTWEGRTGFIKLALRTGTPVIPTVCVGIDELYFNAFNGMTLSEKLFGKEFPLPLCIPVGLGLLPFPTKLTQYVGEPIHFNYPPEAAEDKALVESLQRMVLGRMEGLFNQHLKGRRKLYQIAGKAIRAAYKEATGKTP